MANLKNIRSQIKSVTSIQKVTKAMKMVAAAKLRKSQENMEKARPYSSRIKGLIAHLLNDIEKHNVPLLQTSENSTSHGFLVITADRGLAGSFNTNIIKQTELIINKIDKDQAHLFCIGKKGYEYFKKNNYKVLNYYDDLWTNLNYNNAIQIGSDISDEYNKQAFGTLTIVYNYFKNTASQKIISETLLPLSFTKEEKSEINDIIYEPSKIKIVESLIPKYFNTQIWQFLLESFASEQAARMLYMENATENAKDMINELNLEFNKARQSAITTEMLEIVGGAEALSN